MDINDIKKVLKDLINDDVIESREGFGVEVDIFLKIFGEAELTFSSLTKHADDDVWKQIFSEWKQKGILN